jgi:3-dehydroquinate dehydratase-2
MATILVLHGPNMALKGVSEIDDALEDRASRLGVELCITRSNSEAVLADALYEKQHEADGLIVNLGVLAPSAWVLAEAMALLKKPSIEVLLAELPAERGPSVLAALVAQQIHGKGRDGYLLALEAVTRLLPADVLAEAKANAADDGDEDEDAAEEVDDPAPSAPRGKSIGRRPPAPAAGPSPTAKTIGRRVPGALATPAAAPPRSSAGLTRAVVREKLKARLNGALAAEVLAGWARTEWSALQKNGPCEENRRELLDGVLLTLMAGAKVSDDILLAQLAKLES